MSTIKTWKQLLNERIGDGQITTNDAVRIAMQDHIDALQAKLCAIEAQEPVGHFMDMGEGEWSQMVGEAKYTKPLYAAPVAPAQPVNELAEALEELMHWQVKNVKVWNNSAYDNASRALANAKAAQPLTKEQIAQVIEALEKSHDRLQDHDDYGDYEASTSYKANIEAIAILKVHV